MSESQFRDGASISVNNSNDSCIVSSDPGSGHSSMSESTTDGEGQEDSSSDLEQSESIKEDTDALSSFRQLWIKDINENQNKGKLDDSNVGSNIERKKAADANDDDVKLKAKKWFLEGVESEQNGRLHEAIKFYKKAVQLVPDIEFELCAENKGKEKTEGDALTDEIDSKNKLLANNDGTTDEDDEDSDLDLDLDLLCKLQNFINRSKSICTPEQEMRMTHFSSLPMEIILYIFRWVVSHDLDLRSLEMCSMVCRGFYVVARDPEIWRLACIKIWGVNCGGLKNYDSWRMMFVNRPRLNYNGCYISRTTYFRHGETSFQDEFYKPWHLVEYYRYLRFFPEGRVFMMTTADQPPRVLYKLKERKDRDKLHPSVLTGHYRLQDNRVFIVLQREGLLNNVNKNRRNAVPPDLVRQVYNIELQVANHKQRLNHCLFWKRYCVTTQRGNTETKTNFEVMGSRFPSFSFSRVISYTSEANKPLV